MRSTSRAGLARSQVKYEAFDPESGPEAPSPNDFHFSSVRAACGGERTAPSAPKEAFEGEGRLNFA